MRNDERGGYLRCPFCGGGETDEIESDEVGRVPFQYWLRCSNRECGIQTGAFADRRKLKEFWNKRMTDG